MKCVIDLEQKIKKKKKSLYFFLFSFNNFYNGLIFFYTSKIKMRYFEAYKNIQKILFNNLKQNKIQKKKKWISNEKNFFL